jgi:subtilase family serine protease
MLRKFTVLLLAMMSAGAVLSYAQPQTLLTRHTRDVVLKGQTPYVGKVPANKTLHFDIVLPVRDRAGLDRFVQDVYNPSSPSFHQFLTPEQFTEKFGPSQKDFDALTHFAQVSGFTIIDGSRDGMDLALEGSVASVETAFHVSLGIYHDAKANRDFYAIDREPTVDLPFQLWHITGLDNYSVPRTALHHRPAGPISAATTGSCPSQSFCGSDMRAAYYEGKSLTGKGQNVGLLELAGTDLTDLTAYYKAANQKLTLTPKLLSLDKYPTTCTAASGCDDTEQTLDMTQALGMAPGAQVYMYVCGNAYGTGEFSDTACLSAMTTTKSAPLNLQLSSSWLWNPPDPSTDDPYFQKMGSQGQTFFQAAGDWGAWPGSEDFYWPADDPNIVSVGGTSLTTKGPGEGWASEVGWSPYSGGGISPDDFPIPAWQQLTGVITKANKGSTKYRNGPDISANADFTFFVCSDQGQNPNFGGQECGANIYGGTSFATPMWAGYIALANERASQNGDAKVGFINPAIYPIGVGSDYKKTFHDVVKGNNGFPAEPGYDLITGWGSPNGSVLINDLAPPKK